MSSATANRVEAAVILLVEDDLDDQALMRRALRKGRFRADLQIVSDGQEAMDYLLRRGDFANPECPPRPDLILLDLNMPTLDGGQVLRQIRAHPDLRRIPVVVLTTSREEEDVLRSYDLGCNSFITKPMDMDAFIEMLRTLESYWFQLVTLPSRCKENWHVGP